MAERSGQGRRDLGGEAAGAQSAGPEGRTASLCFGFNMDDSRAVAASTVAHAFSDLQMDDGSAPPDPKRVRAEEEEEEDGYVNPQKDQCLTCDGEDEFAIETLARDPVDYVAGLFDEHYALVQRRAITKRAQLNMAVCTRQLEGEEEGHVEAVSYQRLPGDTYIGDARLRTVRALLHEVDERGFERSNHQERFHDAFLRACSRVLYREEWAVHRTAIMTKNKWATVNSEVMISTPRRFGKVRAHFGYRDALYPRKRHARGAELRLGAWRRSRPERVAAAPPERDKLLAGGAGPPKSLSDGNSLLLAACAPIIYPSREPHHVPVADAHASRPPLRVCVRLVRRWATGVGHGVRVGDRPSASPCLSPRWPSRFRYAPSLCTLPSQPHNSLTATDTPRAGGDRRLFSGASCVSQAAGADGAPRRRWLALRCVYTSFALPCAAARVRHAAGYGRSHR